MTSLNRLAFSSAIVEFVGVFLWIIEIYMDLLFLDMVDGRVEVVARLKSLEESAAPL